MRISRYAAAICAAALILLAQAAAADDRLDYERRAAARYAERFAALDRNADGSVTREEAKGDLNFVPWFDDMDINRDRAVTKQELQRFLEQRYMPQALSGLQF